MGTAAPDGAQTLMTAVQAVADEAEPGDPRTADHRRADTLVDLAACALAGDCNPRPPGPTRGPGRALPRRHGSPPAVQVTVALSTLLGLDQQPGELAGHGPIPASMALRIAADPTGTWRRLITDDHGRLIDRGRSRYRPPRDLAEHVITRDRTCRFPGCRRAAQRCDIDHLRPYQTGGTTETCNLQCLCPRHHHAKHVAGWTVTGNPNGDLRWTSPTGRYDSRPDELPIDHTAYLDTARPPDPGPDPPGVMRPNEPNVPGPEPPSC